MISKYAGFTLLNENLQKARRVLRELKIPETDPNFIKLRALLTRKAGYLGKFTEWLYKDKIDYTQLENLFNRIKNDSLPKQIDEYESPEEIIDSLVRGSAEAAVNQMLAAIPSRTRDMLKEGDECDDCNGGGEMTCDECDGDAEIECDMCDGTGETTEDGKPLGHEPPGRGRTSSKKKTTIPCTKCAMPEMISSIQFDGRRALKPTGNMVSNGVLPCPKKCDKGEIKCKKCNGTGHDESEWEKFKSFLALQKDKKDIIIDFLSKKSGRYGDYDQNEALEHLTDDITKLLNMSSIEDIKKIALSEPGTTKVIPGNRATPRHEIKTPYIKFIYDDDKCLIVAVNYEGIKKFGSSYWCITEDEDTFNGYVEEETRMQLILFVKGKIPLVDERSVMGITMDCKKEIHAAHWEDDDECIEDADRIINGNVDNDDDDYYYDRNGNRRARPSKVASEKPKPLPISNKNIIDAFLTLYGYNKEQLGGVEFEMEEFYIDNINKVLSSPKTRLKDEVRTLFNNFTEYCENNISISDYEMAKKDFITQFKKSVKEKGIKTPLEIETLIRLNLLDICQFDKKWLDIDLILELSRWNIYPGSDEWGPEDGSEVDVNGYIVSVFKYFMENGYDPKTHVNKGTRFNTKYMDLLVSIGVLDISKYYKELSWDKSTITDKSIEWIIENDFDFIDSTPVLSKFAIDYINKNNLVEQHKDQLVSLLNGKAFTKDMCEYIASEIDDVEVSIAAARRVLPPNLLKRFKFDITRHPSELSKEPIAKKIDVKKGAAGTGKVAGFEEFTKGKGKYNKKKGGFV